MLPAPLSRVRDNPNRCKPNTVYCHAFFYCLFWTGIISVVFVRFLATFSHVAVNALLQTDYTALREGSLFELVNLVCWNNVRIDFKTASLQSVHGAQALLRLLIGRWVADIRANQAVRVLEGATPVASFVRLGSAVHRLASHAATLPVNSQVRTIP